MSKSTVPKAGFSVPLKPVFPLTISILGGVKIGVSILAILQTEEAPLVPPLGLTLSSVATRPYGFAFCRVFLQLCLLFHLHLYLESRLFPYRGSLGTFSTFHLISWATAAFAFLKCHSLWLRRAPYSPLFSDSPLPLQRVANVLARPSQPCEFHVPFLN